MEKNKILYIAVLLIVFTLFFKNASADIINFHPGFSVSEEYTDNYFQSENKKEEFNTRWQADFLLESLTKKSATSISYSPSYVDYRTYDENDSLEHQLDINGLYSFTKFTDVNFSQNFSKRISRQIRTGDIREQTSAFFSAGIDNRHAKLSSRGAEIFVSFDDYQGKNIDDNKTLGSSAYLHHWFNVAYGYEAGLSFELVDFEDSPDNRGTYKGRIKFIKKLTKHFQLYTAYKQSFSHEGDSDHIVYNPFAGFDWSTGKTSRVSLGIGVLYNQYNNRKNSTDLFVNADIYKMFDFSRRGSFSVSAGSGYEQTDPQAESLGFNIYYRGGFIYTYRLMKRADFNITSSLKHKHYDESDLNRTDKTFDIGTGLDWSLLRWLSLGVDCTYTDFNTDAVLRTDYEETKVFLSLRLSPSRSSRMITEQKIFNKH